MTDVVPGEPATVEQPATVDRIVNSIGPRLRELRLQHGLSLQQLAERAGVSAAAIHKIERNGMVPTITTLLKLAEAFDRPVGYFVDEEAEGAGPVAYTPASARAVLRGTPPGVEALVVSGSYARFNVDATATTVAPGATSGAGLAQHQGEELVHLIEGALGFEVDGKRYRLGPGDSLHFRTDRPYRWENTDLEPARALWIRLRPR